MIIYKITNTINGNIYIGQTTLSIDDRWKSHLKSAKKSFGKKSAIHNAIRKYGANSFTIVQIDIATSLTELNNKEIEWINKFNSLFPSGYNLKLGGNGGGKHSEDTKHRQSKLKIEKYAKGWMPRIGKKHSEQTKMKISRSKSGKSRGPLSEDHKCKIGNANKDIRKPHSAEWIENHKIKMIGHEVSEETKMKMRLSVKNKKSIRCTNDGLVFDSIKTASIFYGISRHNLSSLLAGRVGYLRSKIDGVKLSFEFYKE